jgi:hypothetical protein
LEDLILTIKKFSKIALLALGGEMAGNRLRLCLSQEAASPEKASDRAKAA